MKKRVKVKVNFGLQLIFQKTSAPMKSPRNMYYKEKRIPEGEVADTFAFFFGEKVEKIVKSATIIKLINDYYHHSDLKCTSCAIV